MVDTGKNNNNNNNRAPAPFPLPRPGSALGWGPRQQEPKRLPSWSRKEPGLPSHKGRTPRCQLAQRWGLRSQLTTCTAQVSKQRKNRGGSPTTRPHEEHRLGVQVVGSVLAGWQAGRLVGHLPLASPLHSLFINTKFNLPGFQEPWHLHSRLDWGPTHSPPTTPQEEGVSQR